VILRGYKGNFLNLRKIVKILVNQLVYKKKFSEKIIDVIWVSLQKNNLPWSMIIDGYI